MVERLADDHRRAKTLAEGIQAIDPRFCDASSVETNIVMMAVDHLGSPAADWITALAAKGLKAGEWSPRSLRFVTHRHVDDAAVNQAIATIRAVSDALGSSTRMDSGRAT
jgi:threonine aldolase